MPSHKEKRILNYTASEMYDLVLDIEEYPKFLPWCIASRIYSKSEDMIDADVTVGYKLFREKFRSKVHIKENNKITIEYLNGPLKNLENKWVFKDLDNGKCEIDFYVSFEMKSIFLSGVANKIFNKVFKKMMHAFEIRALKVYG